jgi:polysaccharide deacetylase family protein (PEP-CTERM system associated)
MSAATRGAANVFTVDVEEWFHICGAGRALAPDRWDRLPSRVVRTTRLLLEELERADVRATFFVLGWVAERHPGLVAEIVAAGHEVGSHGHAHQRAYDLGAAGFAADVRRSVTALRAGGAVAIRAFRAPEWSITARTPWALDLLAKEGFTCDASMAPVRLVGSTELPRHPHFRSTSSGSILEVPPLVADRFGQVMPLGWGWGLRFSSPARVLAGIERANAAGRPGVLMVHPWELDPEPPRVRLPVTLAFAHYFRLSGFRERLRTVLHGARFGAIEDFAACH